MDFTVLYMTAVLKFAQKTFPYHACAYFMQVLVLHLLLQYAVSDRAEACSGALGSVEYYWHSNEKME